MAEEDKIATFRISHIKFVVKSQTSQADHFKTDIITKWQRGRKAS